MINVLRMAEHPLYFQILWLLETKYLLSKYTLTDKGAVANNISLVLTFEWWHHIYIYIFLAIFEMFESVSVKILKPMTCSLNLLYICLIFCIHILKDISFFVNLNNRYQYHAWVYRRRRNFGQQNVLSIKSLNICSIWWNFIYSFWT